MDQLYNMKHYIVSNEMSYITYDEG